MAPSVADWAWAASEAAPSAAIHASRLKDLLIKNLSIMEDGLLKSWRTRIPKTGAGRSVAKGFLSSLKNRPGPSLCDEGPLSEGYGRTIHKQRARIIMSGYVLARLYILRIPIEVRTYPAQPNGLRMILV
jgi:hypothetical protein